MAALIALSGSACGSSANSADRDAAVKAAHAAYERALGRGEDLRAGPCIAEHLPGLHDWVADVAHDPRRPVDDQARNQCARYRHGEAHHFVELDPRGRLIRAE
jgi:hypothetical protein